VGGASRLERHDAAAAASTPRRCSLSWHSVSSCLPGWPVSDAWVTFGAALGGALAGGAISTAGAMWLQHHQETRQRRSELYDEYVWRLIARLEACEQENKSEQFWRASEIIDQLNLAKGATGRAAVLASKADVRWVRKIRDELKPAVDLEGQLDESGSWDQRDDEYQDAVEGEKPVAAAALQKTRQYQGWLRGKLG
jgi:hypothetical protein